MSQNRVTIEMGKNILPSDSYSEYRQIFALAPDQGDQMDL
jgi:hypothetical protein